MRSVINPRRGCGQLVPGGTYVRGDMAGDGREGALEPWVWTLGEQIQGGKNYNVAAPARQMQLVNLPGTLHLQRLVLDALDAHYPPQLEKLPRVALLDHVGSAFYTPYSFADETRKYGPSRRIPAAIAEAIAPYTPIPIIFCHGWMPTVDAAYADGLRAWAQDSETRRFAPTPDAPTWGLEADDYQGDDHWIIPVLRKMHDIAKGKIKPMAKLDCDPGVAKNTLMVEQLFGISWITSVVYVAKGNETRSDLNALWGKGIEPVQIDWSEDE